MAAEINGYEPGTVAHLYLTRLVVVVVVVVVVEPGTVAHLYLTRLAVIIVVYRCSIFLCHLNMEIQIST